MFAIRLPPEIKARLEALAKSTGRTKSYYIQEALLEYLGDLEDLYLAETRLRKMRAGQTRTVPLCRVMKRPGLAS
jgi:RHH-type rel operon transcriptional repressor/antitoxin RelB